MLFSKFSKKHLFISVLCCVLAFSSAFSQAKLKTTQLKNTRVKAAYTEKWKKLKGLLKEKNIDTTNYEVLIRAFKFEKKLEVWVKNKTAAVYVHLIDYDICETSGDLGPKRQEGDGQVPEGFYSIDLFNPTSSYYLSMRINYPNLSDIKKGKKPYGGAIMIHGNCVTIGCIPITDDKIKELYILCLESKAAGNTVKVDSFPCKLTNENMKILEAKHSEELLAFWRNLKTGYDLFERNHSKFSVSVDAKGNYVFK